MYNNQCIVSPPDPDDYLKVKFKKLGVPVVSKQWVIQSLLSQVHTADSAHTKLVLAAYVLS
jgi:hypothetical protein